MKRIEKNVRENKGSKAEIAALYDSCWWFCLHVRCLTHGVDYKLHDNNQVIKVQDRETRHFRISRKRKDYVKFERAENPNIWK